MHENAAADLSQRVSVACELVMTDEKAAKMLPHMCWLYRQLMTELKMRDLEPPELMSMLAILAPVHARKLAAAERAQISAAVSVGVIPFEMGRRSKRFLTVIASGTD